ncbi:MAG: zinc dependent phospholipase C family protein [Coriobacteriales bacterium]|jgi:hypothetical protein|nr:zinc dependent phospholipase C family protein [Coriobacteriales bacterium]
MPALLTHHLFGTSVLSQLGGGAFPSRNERDAFLLGNQGPDPFFYTLFSPALVDLKRFGSTLHHEQVDASFEALRRYTRAVTVPWQKVVDAYLCGYLCHFSLDSVAHPFVYAQQNAITGAGVEGLDQSDGSVVHGQIETDLDAMMLKRATGKTIEDFVIARQILHASDAVLGQLDLLYNYTAWEVYGLKLPDRAFTRGVRDMRTTYGVLRSSTGKKRIALGYLERLARRHSLAQAMSHRADVGERCDFDNEEHASWINPFTGEQSDASFADLFAAALSVALENLRLHEEGAASVLLSVGLDFEGRPTGA